MGAVSKLHRRLGLLVVSHRPQPISVRLQRHLVVNQVVGAAHRRALFFSTFLELPANLHRHHNPIRLAGLPLAQQRVGGFGVIGANGRCGELGKWQKAKKQGNRCFHDR